MLTKILNRNSNAKILNSNDVGERAERAACDWLNRQGLVAVMRNYRCPFGEIDIIMLHNDTLVFVEVRYRKHQQFGGASASVDGRKQKKLVNSANHFLQQHQRFSESPCRFDVLAAKPCQSSAAKQQDFEWQWIQNAIN